MAKYYILLDDKTKKEFETLPANTYILAGLQFADDKGKATVHYLNALRPLCDAKTNQQLIMMDKAGFTFDGKEWKP